MENVKNSLEVLGNFIPVLFIILITFILTSIIICFVCENPSNDTKTKNEDHDTNIKNNAIDSVKVAVENGELSISTANEIAKHNATKQQEIISSPIEKIKTADVRKTNKDKSKAKTPKCDELNNYSTSDEATEIFLTTDETMFMKKNLDILGFSYLLSVSSDSDKRIIENIISKIKGEKPNGKRC